MMIRMRLAESSNIVHYYVQGKKNLVHVCIIAPCMHETFTGAWNNEHRMFYVATTLFKKSSEIEFLI